MEDIVPALLETIQKDFASQIEDSKKLQAALKLLADKKANYLDANNYAIEVGDILAKVLGVNITPEILPDGRMYFNIADRILNPTLQKNYDLIADFAKQVQTDLNKQAKINLKAQVPDLNQDRINGIINRLSDEPNFDDIAWILDDPIVNFTQSVVDDFIKANAEFQFKAGLSPKLTRRVSGHACAWCKNLAGTYDYQDAPADIYRKHRGCRCTVEYDPKDGRGIQNSHSKVWRDPDKDAKIEARKLIGIKEKNLSHYTYLPITEDNIWNGNTYFDKFYKVYLLCVCYPSDCP